MMNLPLTISIAILAFALGYGLAMFHARYLFMRKLASARHAAALSEAQP